MRRLGDICKKRRKLFRVSKNDFTSNSSTDSTVAPIVSGIVPIDAYFNGEYFERGAFFRRMRRLGDICKKRRQLFRVSKNDFTSNCSTDSTVGPIVSGIVPIDAYFNGECFIKGCLFRRMRRLGDICKKRSKLFRVSKNDFTSNCSTDSTVAPIFSAIVPIDAHVNGEYFVEGCLCP